MGNTLWIASLTSVKHLLRNLIEIPVKVFWFGDLDIETWPKYPSTWPPCQNLSLYVCSFRQESDAQTDTQTLPKLLHYPVTQGVLNSEKSGKLLSPSQKTENFMKWLAFKMQMSSWWYMHWNILLDAIYFEFYSFYLFWPYTVRSNWLTGP